MRTVRIPFVLGILTLAVGLAALSTTANLPAAGASVLTADGGAPVPRPWLIADGGAPVPRPWPRLAADGGAPVPRPWLTADGGAPVPRPWPGIAS